MAQWFRSYKHFSKKVKFPEQDHIPQLKKKNEFFTYFEGPEGVQKVITLYNINQGNYTELVNQKKNSKFFFIPFMSNDANNKRNSVRKSTKMYMRLLVESLSFLFDDYCIPTL